MEYQRLTPDPQWASDLVSSFPTSWADTLLDRWKRGHKADRTEANLKHLRACRTIAQAQRAGVRADANDSELREEADKSVRDATRRLQLAEQCSRIGGRDAVPVIAMTGKLWAMEDWMVSRGLGDAWARVVSSSLHGRAVLARATCIRTWRRMLRGLHARAVEGTARTLGLVHKRAGLYVSDESLKRRTGQNERNAGVMESVVAVNEHGQEMTIAELAAKSPASRQIRRMELMTRIAGFELIAKQCGHEALFVTVTCPSRMHAYRTRNGGGVEPNPKHDGTKPGEAQQYIALQWERFTSCLKRWGVHLYGFRIAEPNHDGTPHWHALLFFPSEVGQGSLKRNKRAGRPVAARIVLVLLRRYFLRTDMGVWVDADGGRSREFRLDRDERGAKLHRVKVERIDWSKGSAAGYVAKYVAKNIDGYKVEKDLYGNDTLTSSRRVDAWASTWGIHQFQQVGGAPVGVWREARRLHPEQGEAAHAILMALDAVNISKQAPEDSGEEVRQYTAATGWAEYTELQGGVCVKRNELRIRLLREQSGELGRYGEPVAPRIIGVQTADARRVAVSVLGRMVEVPRTVAVEVESERATWVVVDGAREIAPGTEGTWRMREGARERLADAKRRAMALGEAGRPWSPVNNSTRPGALAVHPDALFGSSVERTRKRGRWHNWKSTGRGAEAKESNHEPPPGRQGQR